MTTLFNMTELQNEFEKFREYEMHFANGSKAMVTDGTVDKIELLLNDDVLLLHAQANVPLKRIFKSFIKKSVIRQYVDFEHEEYEIYNTGVEYQCDYYIPVDYRIFSLLSLNYSHTAIQFIFTHTI